MPRHEGIVTCVKGDGSALVFIRPEDSGIPGAPNVNVCHCASDGSSFTFEAVNGAHASPGDVVSVYSSPGALLRNAAALIGTPMAGILLGIVTGLVWNGGSWTGMERLAISAAAGLVPGLAAGILAYRRLSSENHAVITHIVRKAQVNSSAGEGPGGRNNSTSGCEGCGLHTSFSISSSASPSGSFPA